MKILKLTYNEILKQTKKLSFKICLGILLLIAILFPILSKSFAYDERSNQMYYSDDLKYYKNELIKNPSNDTDKLRNELTQVRIDLIKKCIDEKTTNTNFKNELYNSYITHKRSLIITNYMLDNKDIDYQTILNEFEIYDNTLLNYWILNIGKLKEYKENLLKEVEKENLAIAKNDYSWYLDYKINTYKEYTHEKPDSKNKEELKDYERNLKILSIYQMLKDEGIKDESDNRIKSAETIINSYYEQEDIMPEKQYNKMDYTLKYEDYLKLKKQEIKARNDEVEKAMYAIKNNIDYNKEGARTIFSSGVSTNIVILSVIAVVIAGGIVSNEFQRGTIRLLVIRPAKRYKILLSKLLAVFAIIIGLATISNLVTFIVSGIMYGFSDYSINSLTVANNKVQEVSFLLTNLKNILILLIPVFFVGLGAFTLSTITNNTALSVGFSIFLLVGGELGIIFLRLINFPFIEYTFLPFLNYTQFLTPLSLVEQCDYYQLYYTFSSANIVLIVWSVIFYTVSNIIFTKKDIKN